MHHETVDENRSDSTGIGRIEHRAKRNVEDHEVRHSARAHPPWWATGLLRGTQIRRERRPVPTRSAAPNTAPESVLRVAAARITAHGSSGP